MTAVPQRNFAIPPAPQPPPSPEVMALGELMSVLGQDPKYRDRILELIRDANPNLPIPELDVKRAIGERVDAATKSSEERAAKSEERLAALERSITRDRWAADQGLSEEEMTELEAFAKEKKIGDPEAALDYYRLGRPRSTGSSRVEITAGSRKELQKDPKAWALREGERVLAELRKRRGA